MISLIICWIVLGGLSLVLGMALLRLAGGASTDPGTDALLATWVGLLWLGAAMLAIALVVPLTPVALLAVAGFAAGLVLRRRIVASEPRRPSIALGIGFAAITVALAWLGSEPPTLYDSGVYHVGAIRWLADQGTVSGIALLHNRFGFGSSLFALTAPFDHGPLRSRMSNVVVGLMVLLVLIHVATAWGRLIARRAAPTDVFGAIALLPALVYTIGGLAPSPDVPVLATTAVVGWAVLRVDATVTIVGSRSRLADPRLAPALLASAAAALKLSALPLLAVVGAWYAFAARERAMVLGRAALLSVPPLAFAANAFVGTGCPLYPAPVFCGDTDWSVGAAEAASNSSYVRDFARWGGRLVPAHATDANWVMPWLERHPGAALLIALSLVLAPVAWRRAHGRTGERVIVTMALAGVCYGALSAPAPRFLVGFAVLIPAVMLARLSDVGASTRLPPPRIPHIPFAIVALGTAFLFLTASARFNLRSVLRGGELIPSGSDLALGRPLAVPVPRLWRKRSNDVEYLTPVDPAAGNVTQRTVLHTDRADERCWTALPCTPYLTLGAIRLRDPARGIRGGFARVDQPTR